jgi:hypothetical protein
MMSVKPWQPEKIMPSVEYDLAYMRAGVSVLEDYLHSKEIYWSLGESPPRGEPAFPSLTLGGVLISRTRLHARPLPSNHRDELSRLDERINEVRARWRVAWEGKASNEFRARLNLWRDFLEEYRQSPEANADRYGYEVSRRVMLHLLGHEAGDIPPSQIELLSALDKLLHAVFVPGKFIWNPEMAQGFPAEIYWYLYGTLKKS